jgi:hypothetical protein
LSSFACGVVARKSGGALYLADGWIQCAPASWCRAWLLVGLVLALLVNVAWIGALASCALAAKKHHESIPESLERVAWPVTI